jgi:hypothetical protein
MGPDGTLTHFELDNDDRINQVDLWLAQAWSPARIRLEAKRQWSATAKDADRYIQVARERRRQEALARAPYHRTDVLATLEAVLAKAFEVEDLDLARRVTLDIAEIAGVTSGGEAMPPPAPETPRSEIHAAVQTLVDSLPHERQARLAELVAKRARLGLPVPPEPPPRAPQARRAAVLDIEGDAQNGVDPDLDDVAEPSWDGEEDIEV